MADKNSEIEDLKSKLSEMEDDFQTLQENKNALDTEIAVYRKLMESEEDRLGIETSKMSKD